MTPEVGKAPWAQRVRSTRARVLVQLAWLASQTLGDDVASRAARRGLLRAFGARLHPSASVHGGTWFSNPANLTVGRRTLINRNCYLDLHDRIDVHDGVTVGHGTVIVTTVHALGPAERRCGPPAGSAPVVLEEGCWLGANVTVLPGVTVGAGAVVAAGALVIEDVPANTVVAGVPARTVRKLED